MTIDLVLGDTTYIISEAVKAGLLRNELAYVLATAYHETGHTMKPINEAGSSVYLHSKSYWPYIGRGYVQLTWLANYKKASAALGVDFVNNPALLLRQEYAAPILIRGMKEGWFTGKKLSNYIDLQHSDFVGARYIVNVQDKAFLIASYAKLYDTLLTQTGYGIVQLPPLLNDKLTTKEPKIWMYNRSLLDGLYAMASRLWGLL